MELTELQFLPYFRLQFFVNFQIKQILFSSKTKQKMYDKHKSEEPIWLTFRKFEII